MPRRILVTGSRNWTDRDAIQRALLKHGVDGDTLVHGDCELGGADQIAAELWEPHGPVEPHPARRGGAFGSDSGRYRRRNQHMVDLGADLCLVFALDWASGSGQCARMARRAGVRTYDFGVSTVQRAS